jgi:hypothetical protein
MPNVIIVSRATDIHRDENGRVFAWRMSEKGKRKFTDLETMRKYVRRVKNLDTLVAFSGSASTLHMANEVIAQEKANR